MLENNYNMIFEKVAETLLSQYFKNAKTAIRNPHAYTLRENWKNDILFNNVVKYIREHSEIEWFWKKPYQIFKLNGYKYWTMGAPINETILINRAIVEYKTEYDIIADKYFEMFNNKESHLEELELFKKLDIKGSVLDIGCGYGMALNYINSEKYLGIDISINQLKTLKQNFINKDVLNCAFEDFYTPLKFDTIISLFGSPSYINPTSLHRVKSMLSVGGKAYLMYFKDGYFPITHKNLNINTNYFTSNEDGYIFNNYKIVTYENNDTSY